MNKQANIDGAMKTVFVAIVIAITCLTLLNIPIGTALFVKKSIVFIFFKLILVTMIIALILSICMMFMKKNDFKNRTIKYASILLFASFCIYISAFMLVSNYKFTKILSNNPIIENMVSFYNIMLILTLAICSVISAFMPETFFNRLRKYIKVSDNTIAKIYVTILLVLTLLPTIISPIFSSNPLLKI